MTMNHDDTITPEEMKARLRQLGLFGLLGCWDEVQGKPWLADVLAIEERERKRRSLERRVSNAKIGSFKSMADFDWAWPAKIDREAIDDLFTLGFLDDGHNAVLLGPNGTGKTMILKNLAHHAVVHGSVVRFTTASEMLADLATHESSVALARRLRRYTLPRLLCIDEVGYLSYDSRYADLLFEVVTRRYESGKAILISTNKVFEEWVEVFPHAACVVTLVDRLLHRAEVIAIDGESYRLKEAKDNATARTKRRKGKPPQPKHP
jgi:DNA replication protein DnaC